MRIVSGTLRGRVISSPSAKTTRPTTDRVRESMFSSIYSRADLEGACVLDAFAGSGALGIEALSRGAARCVFFERDAAARRVLSRNLKSLGIERGTAVVRGDDVLQAAQRGFAGLPSFGLVMLDPPYALGAGEVAGLLNALAKAGCLQPGCVIAYEHDHANSKQVEELFSDEALYANTGLKKYGKIGVLYLEYTAGGGHAE